MNITHGSARRFPRHRQHTCIAVMRGVRCCALSSSVTCGGALFARPRVARRALSQELKSYTIVRVRSGVAGHEDGSLPFAAISSLTCCRATSPNSLRICALQCRYDVHTPRCALPRSRAHLPKRATSPRLASSSHISVACSISQRRNLTASGA